MAFDDLDILKQDIKVLYFNQIDFGLWAKISSTKVLTENLRSYVIAADRWVDKVLVTLTFFIAKARQLKCRIGPGRCVCRLENYIAAYEEA